MDSEPTLDRKTTLSYRAQLVYVEMRSLRSSLEYNLAAFSPIWFCVGVDRIFFIIGSGRWEVLIADHSICGSAVFFFPSFIYLSSYLFIYLPLFFPLSLSLSISSIWDLSTVWESLCRVVLLSVDAETILMFLHRGNFSISPRCLREHRFSTFGPLLFSLFWTLQCFLAIRKSYSFYATGNSRRYNDKIIRDYRPSLVHKNTKAFQKI